MLLPPLRTRPRGFRIIDHDLCSACRFKTHFRGRSVYLNGNACISNTRCSMYEQNHLVDLKSSPPLSYRYFKRKNKILQKFKDLFTNTTPPPPPPRTPKTYTFPISFHVKYFVITFDNSSLGMSTYFIFFTILQYCLVEK